EIRSSYFRATRRRHSARSSGSFSRPSARARSNRAACQIRVSRALRRIPSAVCPWADRMPCRRSCASTSAAVMTEPSTTAMASGGGVVGSGGRQAGRSAVARIESRAGTVSGRKRRCMELALFLGGAWCEAGKALGEFVKVILEDVVAGACIARGLSQGWFVALCQNDHLAGWPCLPEESDSGEPVHLGQAQVHHGEVGLLLGEAVQGVAAGGALDDVPREWGQHFSEQAAHVLGIIDDHDSHHHGRFRRPAPTYVSHMSGIRVNPCERADRIRGVAERPHGGDRWNYGYAADHPKTGAPSPVPASSTPVPDNVSTPRHAGAD